MNFFNKLPTISYNGNIARNIMARAKLSDSTKSNSRLFYPYTTGGEERIDTLSQQYYGSPGYTWLIWFANETIDPYYDMPLDEYDLEQLIINKYGSIAQAQRKISHYKINWKDAENGISTDLFNALKTGEQKYWEPVLDPYLNVRGYRRKQEDQIINTNRVCSISIIGATGTFKQGEEIQVSTDTTIYGFCTYSDDSNITVQHVSGLYKANHIVIGKESGAQALVTSANNLLSTTPAFDEPRYWKPVSYYDYEVELNEKKKQIQLLDANKRDIAEQELDRVMNVT